MPVPGSLGMHVPLPRARARRRRAESASGRGAARAAKRARRGGGLPQDVDGSGRRVGRRVLDAQGVELEYRGWIYRDLLRPIAEVDGSGNVNARYVYLDGEGSKQNGMHQLATRLGANQDTSLPFAGSNVPEFIELLDSSSTVTQRLRLIVNQVGTVQAVVDVATGEVVQRLEHDEFGRVLFDSNPGLQPFGFAGGLVDADTGLVRFGARDYEPVTGRWTARDPVRFAGGDNQYAYLAAAPHGAKDPAGTDGCGMAAALVCEIVCVAATKNVPGCSLVCMVATDPVDCGTFEDILNGLKPERRGGGTPDLPDGGCDPSSQCCSGAGGH